MIAVWESDISAKATFLISCLKWLTDTAVFKLLGMLFHNIPSSAVREAAFQIVGTWFG